MDSYEIFLRERIEIGAGRVAKVYAYGGYAYKCFAEGYPGEWIDFEYGLQQEVAKSGLPVPHYYRSEFPHSIKMDLIEGVSMLDRLAIDGEDAVMAEMMVWFEKIHETKGLKLASLSEHIAEEIGKAPVSGEQRDFARQCCAEVDDEISEPDALCHMDYHFLNVMYSGNDVRIIDWMNAKNGKPIWDYARTYVIFCEHLAGMKDMYLEKVLAKYPKAAFMKAAFVSAICRLNEHDTEQVRRLIEEFSSEK